MRSRSPSSSSRKAPALTASNRGYSRRSMSERTVSGMINAVAPKISAILAMFDPIALPMAMPGLPCSAAIVDTRISGAEVPNPTTVSPISRGGTPRLRASAAAPMTKRSAPHTRRPRPNTMAVTAGSIGLGCIHGAAESGARIVAKRLSLVQRRSVGAHLDPIAARAAVTRHQLAQLHIEYRRFVDHPLVVAAATKGIATMAFAGLAWFEG